MLQRNPPALSRAFAFVVIFYFLRRLFKKEQLCDVLNGDE
jgi:hypothetical protein